MAKTAAAFDRMPPAALRKVRAAGLAVEHSLAKLGVVTYASNNYKAAFVKPDGSQGWRTLRDSAPGQRPPRTKAARAITPRLPAGPAATTPA